MKEWEKAKSNMQLSRNTFEGSGPTNHSLEPYLGEWNYVAAAHLLRRITFGPAPRDVLQSLAIGLASTLDQAFQWKPLPEPPLNHEYHNDPYVPIGESWVNAPYTDDLRTIGYRSRSLQGWIIEQAVRDHFSVREKLTFFWQNHFGCHLVNDPKFVYRFNMLLRRYATGNFRTLVKEVTVDPLMLIHLDGQLNKKTAPNDNYARELLELFTVGKGAQIAPGDYATFTEKDVEEIAKVMTGWVVHGFQSKYEQIPVSNAFWTTRHDRSTKVLSHHFNHAILQNQEETEYAALIDILFQGDLPAKFICRKLYRFFVCDQIDEAIETAIIAPLAAYLVEQDYEMMPVLKRLLSSQHFFEMGLIGAKIKTPLDFMVSLIKQIEVPIPETLKEKTISYQFFYQRLVGMGFEYFAPPFVAGWIPMFQGPLYGALWINSATIGVRYNLAYNLSKSYFDLGDFQIQSQPFNMLQYVEDPFSPEDIVKGFAKTLLPHELAPEQQIELKELFLDGLHDHEWKVMLTEYADDPDGYKYTAKLQNKMRNLLLEILSMPGFQLH